MVVSPEDKMARDNSFRRWGGGGVGVADPFSDSKSLVVT